MNARRMLVVLLAAGVALAVVPAEAATPRKPREPRRPSQMRTAQQPTIRRTTVAPSRRVAPASRTAPAARSAPPAVRSSVSAGAVEPRLLSYINAGRARVGRASLRPHGRLAAIARNYSAVMARRGFLSHAGFHTRWRSGEPRATAACENLARFRTSQQLSADGVAQTFYRLWLNSPSHRRCMYDLTRVGYNFAGVGVYQDAGGGWWATLELVRV